MARFSEPPYIKGVINIPRRKRYIRGRVYKLNDHVLVKNSKSNRRVVALNNDKNEMHVRRIFSLYDKNGKKREGLIPIGRYPDIKNPSGLEDKNFRKTLKGNPIQEKYLIKTNTRLNKWDMQKIFKYKNKK